MAVLISGDRRYLFLFFLFIRRPSLPTITHKQSVRICNALKPSIIKAIHLRNLGPLILLLKIIKFPLIKKKLFRL